MKRWQETDTVHLDLQGLSPPEPMVAILREIEGGARGPLVVHMDRDPIYLYSELIDRGWTWRPVWPDERAGAGGDLPEQAPVILELKPEAAS